MSVRLDGIDLPERCCYGFDSCPLFSPGLSDVKARFWCRASGRMLFPPFDRPGWCPLSEIKEEEK